MILCKETQFVGEIVTHESVQLAMAWVIGYNSEACRDATHKLILWGATHNLNWTKCHYPDPADRKNKKKGEYTHKHYFVNLGEGVGDDLFVFSIWFCARRN